MRGFVAGFGLAAIALMSLCLGAVGAQDDAKSPAFYTEKVKPIFQANCAKCHLDGMHRGAFNMDTKQGMYRGGKDGSVLTPGDPGNSLLVKLIRHEGPADDPMPMPPGTRPKVSDADIAIVTQWVKAGAVMPDDAAKP